MTTMPRDHHCIAFKTFLSIVNIPVLDGCAFTLLLSSYRHQTRLHDSWSLIFSRFPNHFFVLFYIGVGLAEKLNKLAFLNKDIYTENALESCFLGCFGKNRKNQVWERARGNWRQNYQYFFVFVKNNEINASIYSRISDSSYQMGCSSSSYIG